ncbi:MAG: lytic transglycosylase domain-containing protein [Sporomusaceae bacterium]|nr:lytic transglycosylase domain-containing protein [Sporomusaceae bacterium]
MGNVYNGVIGLRKWSWTRRIITLACIFMIASYVVYESEWFQKKYVYPLLYQNEIFRYAERHDLDPYLVAAVIRTESKFSHLARSPKGAMGLMQMMPDTAEWVAQEIKYPNFTVDELNNPVVSIRFGTWYLASVEKEFGGNEVLMLAAYNGGRGNVKSWMKKYGWSNEFHEIDEIPFKETREYVKKVLRDRETYRLLYEGRK